jgi:hypothetical protein
MLGAVTGNHEFGWAALGGFEATLADLGGSYQAPFDCDGTAAVKVYPSEDDHKKWKEGCFWE